MLSLIAAGFLALTRTEVRVARNALDNARAEALADAGVYRGIQALLAFTLVPADLKGEREK